VRKLGRPFVYRSEDEKPVTVSLRIPRDLYEQAQRYVRMHLPITFTELLIDGLRLRLETPADPRDVILSNDNTVMQQLQDMVDTAVQTALAKVSSAATRVSEALAEPVSDISHDNNTVIQEKASQPQRRPGRPTGSIRERQEALSATELKVHLKAEKSLSDTLQGMVRTGILKRNKRGKETKYFLA
jgi:hypothetical protein